MYIFANSWRLLYQQKLTHTLSSNYIVSFKPMKFKVHFHKEYTVFTNGGHAWKRLALRIKTRRFRINKKNFQQMKASRGSISAEFLKIEFF